MCGCEDGSLGIFTWQDFGDVNDRLTGHRQSVDCMVCQPTSEKETASLSMLKHEKKRIRTDLRISPLVSFMSSDGSGPGEVGETTAKISDRWSRFECLYRQLDRFSSECHLPTYLTPSLSRAFSASSSTSFFSLS